jgi:hypothetical protein
MWTRRSRVNTFQLNGGEKGSELNGINLVRNSGDLRELATLAKVEDLGVE